MTKGKQNSEVKHNEQLKEHQCSTKPRSKLKYISGDDLQKLQNGRAPEPRLFSFRRKVEKLILGRLMEETPEEPFSKNHFSHHMQPD